MLEIQQTIRIYNENAEWLRAKSWKWRSAKSWTWVVVAVPSIIVFFAMTWSQGFALMSGWDDAQRDSAALKAHDEKVKQAEKLEDFSKRKVEDAKVKLHNAEKKIAFARNSFELANISEKQFVENKEFSDAQNRELTKLEKEIANHEEAVKDAQSDVDRKSKSTEECDWWCIFNYGLSGPGSDRFVDHIVGSSASLACRLDRCVGRIDSAWIDVSFIGHSWNADEFTNRLIRITSPSHSIDSAIVTVSVAAKVGRAMRSAKMIAKRSMNAV